MFLQSLKRLSLHNRDALVSLPAPRSVSSHVVRAGATVVTPASGYNNLSGTRVQQFSSIVPFRLVQESPVHNGEDEFRSPTATPFVPGPSSTELSSGADFIDLIHMDETEAHQRLQDAQTFKMLGCSAGVLTRSRGEDDAPARTRGAGFNVRRLKAFRDNMIRNLAPTVARGFVEARCPGSHTSGSKSVPAHHAARSVATAASGAGSIAATTASLSSASDLQGSPYHRPHADGQARSAHHRSAAPPCPGAGPASSSAPHLQGQPASPSLSPSVGDTFPPLFSSLEAPTSASTGLPVAGAMWDEVVFVSTSDLTGTDAAVTCAAEDPPVVHLAGPGVAATVSAPARAAGAVGSRRRRGSRGGGALGEVGLRRAGRAAGVEAEDARTVATTAWV